MRRLRAARRTAAATSAVALAALATSGPAAFAAARPGDDKVDVVNTETVQVYMDPDGRVQSSRVYEQLVLTGTGKVDIENPVSTKGLRNLDGFGGFDVRHGKQVGTFDVDGVTRARSVSDFDGKLPLDVHVAYSLNGREVKPGDVVGENGQLKVTFTVKNVTSESREVTVPDGKGGTVKRTVDVAIPMVGSLTTVAPPSFADVKSDQANMAGDGRGGTKLTFTMTLFPPIGSPEATFGYTAQITDGVVPRIDVSALPVNPLKSPSFKTAATSYQSGADTGAQLASGALEIDSNLLKLRDGASDLLAGLLKLHAGSEELQTGLAGKLAPGAKRLAAGNGDLDEGLGLIDDGEGKAAAGAGTLAEGTGDAFAGSTRLRDGLGQISGGLSQLASAQGLPKAAGAVDLLKAGVDQVLAGFGAVGQTGTLMDGLSKIEGGAGALNTGASQLAGGLGQLVAPTGLPAAKGGVDDVKGGLDQALATGGSLDQLKAGLNALLGLDCGPVCQGVITTQILPGLASSRTNLQAASAGLGQVSGGLATAIGGLNQQLIPGAQGIAAGAAALADGATKAKAGAGQLKGGVAQVRDGLEQLDAGLTSAVSGVLQLNGGAGQAYSGSVDLADGLGRIDAGAGTLADKLGLLADGTARARDASGKLAAGAGELSAGVDRAAQGSGDLADGLGQAAAGAPQLVDGAGRLSKEGTQVIAGKGSETAQEYGTLYAVLEQGAERADTERMAYGAPDGAAGLTAYTYVINADDGEGSRNWVRTAGGAALLAASGGVVLLRRRLLG
jgi:putative membrane protein